MRMRITAQAGYLLFPRVAPWRLATEASAMVRAPEGCPFLSCLLASLSSFLFGGLIVSFFGMGGFPREAGLPSAMVARLQPQLDPRAVFRNSRLTVIRNRIRVGRFSSAGRPTADALMRKPISLASFAIV